MRFFRNEAHVPYYNESRSSRVREPMPPTTSEERGNCRGEPIEMREGGRDARSCPLNEDALMRKIQELSFVAVELELYLDAYPECTKALEHYRSTTRELAALTEEYERLYGPLTARNSRGERWTWTMGKWPWHTDDRR